MKKYTSILMLYARSTIFPLLGILLLAGAVEAGLFYLAMDPALPLEETVLNSRISLVCGAAFLLWTAALSLFQLFKSGYAMRRVQLKPRTLFVCHTLYNALCYVLFWSFQVCLLWGLFRWFGTKADPVIFGPQSTMLTFYRIHFLHSLLPLSDWTLYLRNGCLSLLLGAVTAYPLFKRGSLSSQITMAVFALLTLWLFPVSMSASSWNLVVSVLSIFCFASFLWIAKDPGEETGTASAALTSQSSDVFKEVHGDEP